MKKWIKFIILYLGCTLISVSFLKVPPIMKELSAHLGITDSEASYLMSVFFISGMLLAIPGGAFLSKFGGKKLAISVIVFLFIGNMIGMLSQNFYALILSRAIEGISFSLIIMLGVVLINHWFPKNQSGLPIGIFGTASAFATMIAMNIFRPIFLKWGMEGVWGTVAILSLICLIFFIIFIDAPQNVIEDKKENKSNLLLKALSNRSVLILAFCQGCMAFVLFTYITAYPKIFQEHYGLDPDTANSYSALFGLFGIPFGTVAGFVIDKTGKPILVSLLSFITLAISTLATLYLSSSTYIIQVFFLSASIGLASSAIVITVSRIVKDSKLLGYSMAFVSQLYFVGIFVGSPIVLWVVEKNSWIYGVYLLTGVALIGMFGILYLFISNLKIKTEAEHISENIKRSPVKSDNN